MGQHKFAFLIFFCFHFFKVDLHANGRTIDSLNRELKTAAADSTRVDLHAKLSNLLLATDYKESFKHAMLAVQLAEKNSDYAPKVKAYRVAGAVCMFMGLNDLAVKYYSRYYELAESKKDTVEMGAAYFNLASVQIALNDHVRAKEVLLKAERLLQKGYQEKGQEVPSLIVLMFRSNLGLLYQQLGELSRADSVLFLAFPMVMGVPGQEVNLMKLYQVKARLFISKKELDSALFSIYAARRLASELGDIPGTAATYFSSGEIFQQKGNRLTAIVEFSEGYRAAEQVGATSLQVLFAEPLYKLYQQVGNADSSKRYFEIYTALKSQAKDMEAKEQLMRDELLREYKLMEVTMQEKVASDKKVYLYIIVGALAAALLGFGGALAYRRRYRRSELEKVRKELESQRRELERLKLEATISQQEKQLAEYEYKIAKNEMLESLVHELQGFIARGSEQMTPKNSDAGNIKEMQQGKIWEEFEIRFLTTHAGFYDRLLTAHPNLTQNERRLCAFLRLDMATKEISVITGQSIRAVQIARIRLRKKLSLSNSERGLFEYLSAL